MYIINDLLKNFFYFSIYLRSDHATNIGVNMMTVCLPKDDFINILFMVNIKTVNNGKLIMRIVIGGKKRKMLMLM